MIKVNTPSTASTNKQSTATQQNKVETKNEEPRNSALDARKAAAEKARIKTQSKLNIQNKQND